MNRGRKHIRKRVVKFHVGEALYERLQQAADAHYTPLAREIRQRLLDSFESHLDTDETLSVPDAGARYFGLGRNSSYWAAARGDIPTIRVGKKLRVPVRLMERKLNGLP